MNILKPIHTETTECQDCYKCLRVCDFKAIKIEKGRALIINDKCVYCGKCVEVCPAEAKKIRNDFNRVKYLLSRGKKVILSLAPSFKTEFPGIVPGKLVSAIKKLGFYGVSETALGAEEVSAHFNSILTNNKKGIFISSACPVVVEIINKYYPLYNKKIVDLFSPVLAHSIMLKKHYGEDVAVVFTGPCIAKKIESDNNPEILNLAITFKCLKDMFYENNILLDKITEEESFIPKPAEEGSLYPIEGGMINTIKSNCLLKDSNFIALSGISNIKKILDDINYFPEDKQIILELLSCEGGCINGPVTSKSNSNALKKFNIIETAIYEPDTIPKKPTVEINTCYDKFNLDIKIHSDADIKDVLTSIGKYKDSDNLNCSGCGYNSCFDFANAILNNEAERQMCVSYMRKLAQKKANVLIKTMPSGVVIVNDTLNIVECNYNFAKLFIGEAEQLYEVQPGLEGAVLNKIVPESIIYLFQDILKSGKDLLVQDIKTGDLFFNITLFTIEKNRIIGAIFQDITSPVVRRKNIIEKAQQVISKNISTVQKIASLLGENAVDTEVILNSIIDSFDIKEV